MKTKSYSTARNTVFGSAKKKKVTGSPSKNKKTPLIDKSIFEKIGIKTSPGMSDGIKKTNQDSFFKETIVLAGEKTTLLVVMDGHGLEGHRCSANLKSNISPIFKKTFSLISGIKIKPESIRDDNETETIKEHNEDDEMIKNPEFDWENFDFSNFFTVFCKKLNNNLCANKKFGSDMSGSTGIFVWGVKNKLIIANVGDSRAIMLQKEQGNTFKGVALSRDQVPSIQEERDRIEAAGGVIRPSRGIPIQFLTYKRLQWQIHWPFEGIQGQREPPRSNDEQDLRGPGSPLCRCIMRAR